MPERESVGEMADMTGQGRRERVLQALRPGSWVTPQRIASFLVITAISTMIPSVVGIVGSYIAPAAFGRVRVPPDSLAFWSVGRIVLDGELHHPLDPGAIPFLPHPLLRTCAWDHWHRREAGAG